MRSFNYEIVEGFLPGSLDGSNIGLLSFAHIDLDLKQGTAEVLDFCWERLSTGGVIVLDDYGFKSCSGVTRAVDNWSQKNGVQFAHISSGQAFAFKLSPKD